MDRLEHLGIIRKGLTGYSTPVVLVKWKNQNLYQVCSDFCILNEKLVKINHAFPLVRDFIEQLGRKKCHYLSMIDLRDAFHTLQLFGFLYLSQKLCLTLSHKGKVLCCSYFRSFIKSTIFFPDVEIMSKY